MRSVHEISKLMYDLALKSFNKDYFTFQQLIEKMRSAKLIRSDEQVGIIYLQLLNSPNFLYVGDNKWTICGVWNKSFINRYKNAIYDMESTIEVSQDSETENAIPLVDQDEAADDISAKVAIQEKVLESTEKTEIKDVVDTNDQDDDDEDDLDNNE